MKEELEKLVATGKISRQHLSVLEKLIECGYGFHKSWGVGKVVNVDFVSSRIVIDFNGKPGHSMDLEFCAKSLKPISASHILARKIGDIQKLKELAAVNRPELVKIVLQSFGGKATFQQVMDVLVPDVISEDWKIWWNETKIELQKNGHFLLPIKKNDPLVYVETEVSIKDRLMSEIRSARGLKARVNMVLEFIKNLDEIENPNDVAAEAINLLNGEINSHARTRPSTALEALFVRDDLQNAVNITPEPDQLKAKDIWLQNQQPIPVIEQIPAYLHKRALASFKEAYPENWTSMLIESLNQASARVCGEIVQILVDEGLLERLKEHIQKLILQHNASSELLLWLLKDRSDTFADIIGPDLFRAVLSAIEREQYGEKKTSRLKDYIVDDPDLLPLLIEFADLDTVRDLTRAIQLSPSFNDMDKRALLGRIVKLFPAIQPMISGERHMKQSHPLIVSWESLENKKKEYAELVNRLIPENAKEIAHARSYGDLRENHEYKAAKERQRLLLQRKAMLEEELSKARGTNFNDARADVVSIGTKVFYTELGSNTRSFYVILGAWDSDPNNNIISYRSPIAQAMLNHVPGDIIEFSLEGYTRKLKIESIELWAKRNLVAESSPSTQKIDSENNPMNNSQ